MRGLPQLGLPPLDRLLVGENPVLNLLPAPLYGVAPIDARDVMRNVAEFKSSAKKRFYAVCFLFGRRNVGEKSVYATCG